MVKVSEAKKKVIEARKYVNHARALNMRGYTFLKVMNMNEQQFNDFKTFVKNVFESQTGLFIDDIRSTVFEIDKRTNKNIKKILEIAGKPDELLNKRALVLRTMKAVREFQQREEPSSGAISDSSTQSSSSSSFETEASSQGVFASAMSGGDNPAVKEEKKSSPSSTPPSSLASTAPNTPPSRLGSFTIDDALEYSSVSDAVREEQKSWRLNPLKSISDLIASMRGHIPRLSTEGAGRRSLWNMLPREWHGYTPRGDRYNFAGPGTDYNARLFNDQRGVPVSLIDLAAMRHDTYYAVSTNKAFRRHADLEMIRNLESIKSNDSEQNNQIQFVTAIIKNLGMGTIQVHKGEKLTDDEMNRKASAVDRMFDTYMNWLTSKGIDYDGFYVNNPGKTIAADVKQQFRKEFVAELKNAMETRTEEKEEGKGEEEGKAEEKKEEEKEEREEPEPIAPPQDDIKLDPTGEQPPLATLAPLIESIDDTFVKTTLSDDGANEHITHEVFNNRKNHYSDRFNDMFVAAVQNDQLAHTAIEVCDPSLRSTDVVNQITYNPHYYTETEVNVALNFVRDRALRKSKAYKKRLPNLTIDDIPHVQLVDRHIESSLPPYYNRDEIVKFQNRCLPTAFDKELDNYISIYSEMIASGYKAF